jgi:hypothetical protein
MVFFFATNRATSQRLTMVPVILLTKIMLATLLLIARRV